MVERALLCHREAATLSSRPGRRARATTVINVEAADVVGEEPNEARRSRLRAGRIRPAPLQRPHQGTLTKRPSGHQRAGRPADRRGPTLFRAEEPRTDASSGGTMSRRSVDAEERRRRSALRGYRPTPCNAARGPALPGRGGTGVRAARRRGPGGGSARTEPIHLRCGRPGRASVHEVADGFEATDHRIQFEYTIDRITTTSRAGVERLGDPQLRAAVVQAERRARRTRNRAACRRRARRSRRSGRSTWTLCAPPGPWMRAAAVARRTGSLTLAMCRRGCADSACNAVVLRLRRAEDQKVGPIVYCVNRFTDQAASQAVVVSGVGRAEQVASGGSRGSRSVDSAPGAARAPPAVSASVAAEVASSRSSPSNHSRPRPRCRRPRSAAVHAAQLSIPEQTEAIGVL